MPGLCFATLILILMQTKSASAGRPMGSPCRVGPGQTGRSDIDQKMQQMSGEALGEATAEATRPLVLAMVYASTMQQCACVLRTIRPLVVWEWVLGWRGTKATSIVVCKRVIGMVGEYRVTSSVVWKGL